MHGNRRFEKNSLLLFLVSSINHVFSLNLQRENILGSSYNELKKYVFCI